MLADLQLTEARSAKRGTRKNTVPDQTVDHASAGNISSVSRGARPVPSFPSLSI
jgi:hypothetical protein